MKIINVSFLIKEDKREEFLADVKPLLASARLEEGCIEYHLYESIEKSNQFVMIENWESQAALDLHNQNPLLLNLSKNLPNYVEKQPVITVLEKQA